MPPTQDWPAGHATPQRPQLALSVLGFVQPMPEQKIWPVTPHAHEPFTQA